MKKYFLSIVALAGMLFATSCQESLVEPQVGGTTTFTVQVPDQMGTKAIGDAANTNKLYVQVYPENFSGNAPIYNGSANMGSDGMFRVSINLIQGHKYGIIFWAQNESSKYNVNNLRKIDLNIQHHNSELGAAFYHTMTFEAGESQEVVLRRPFAQLNLGTSAGSLLTNVSNSAIQLYTSKVIVTGIASSFNTLTGKGEVESSGTYTYETNFADVLDYTTDKLNVDGTDYHYISMDYLPVVDNESLVTVQANVTTSAGEIKHSFTNVPVKKNYRTNIVGNLISSTTDFVVKVNDDWEDPDNNIVKTEVSNATELQAAIENTVGGEIVLTDDIVLTQTLEFGSASTKSGATAETEFILDLNGKTITTAWDDESAGKHHYAFTNYANLVVKNGKIEARGTFNYGTLIIEDRTTINAIDRNGGYGVRNYKGAKFIMNGGTVAATKDDGDAPEQGYDATPIRVDAGAEAVINDGTIYNRCNYTPVLENYGDVTINGGMFESYWSALSNYNEMTIKGGKVTILEEESINGSVHPIYAGLGSETKIEGGIFNARTDKPSCYSIAAEDKNAASVEISGGEFSQTGGKKHFSGNLLTVTVTGGTFYYDPSARLAEGYGVLSNANDTYTVIPTTLKDGAVLDLQGAEYDGTITIEGNVTIKGDTKIKTLKSTTGCTITIEEGKTLTLNNFSFGSTETAGKEYEIKGGTVVANYGFFQHGTYALRSNFETGYMYYSFGSDITVYGIFHSQGKGDGLDYVRGKLTIAKGGKSYHDKSLWVGQPASWGAMNATLTIEEGGYVQANSLSVYEGSSLTYSNDADLKYNSVTGTEYIIKK